jgi:hypothetical protein
MICDDREWNLTLTGNEISLITEALEVYYHDTLKKDLGDPKVVEQMKDLFTLFGAEERAEGLDEVEAEMIQVNYLEQVGALMDKLGEFLNTHE